MGDYYYWRATSGSWDLASNWNDATTNQDPAPAPPDVDDSVTIVGEFQGDDDVITGVGASASLAVLDDVVLAGQFTTGALNIGGRLYLDVGDSLTVTGDAGGNSSIAVVDSVLTVEGTFTTSGGSLSGVGGARISLAKVAPSNGSFSADAVSSIEIGTANDATPGAISFDSGTSVAFGGTLSAPNIIDNGVISISGVGVLNGLTLEGAIGGDGQIRIGSDDSLTLGTVNPASRNTIDFTAPGGLLTVPIEALNASNILLPSIAGFRVGDAIEFEGTVTSAAYENGVLSLLDGATTVARLNLVGSYTSDVFDVAMGSERGIGSVSQIAIHGSGDTITPPAGTSGADQYDWVSGVDGSWDLAANWKDVSADDNPALVAPGADDLVAIETRGFTPTEVTGSGDSATLTIEGSVYLAGAFTTGASNQFDSVLGLGVGGSLTVMDDDRSTNSSISIDGGALTVDGSFIAHGNAGVALDDGSFTVDGTFVGTVTGDDVATVVSGTNGARIELASFDSPIDDALNVDSASSLEIGLMGGAAQGAITIDAGATMTVDGSLTAPSIIDNGAIIVGSAGHGTLTLNGALSGDGQIELGTRDTLVFDGAASAQTPTIYGFGAGDSLFFANVAYAAADAVGVAGNGSGGSVVTVDDGSTAVAQFTLDGYYFASQFSLNDDAGHLGITSQIAITTAAALPDATSVTLTGTVEAGDAGRTISIYDGSTLVGTTSANSSDDWMVTVSLAGALAGSPHVLTAQLSTGGVTYASNTQDLGVGGGEVMELTGGPDSTVSLYGTSGDWDTVSGSDGTIYMNGAQAGVSGGGDTVDFASGSVDTVTLADIAGDPDTVNGYGGTIYLVSAQATVNGGGDTVFFSGDGGNAVTLSGTAGEWDAVYGSGGVIDLVGAQAGVSGGGDTVNFATGFGDKVSLSNTAGNKDGVNGSTGTIYLAGAQAVVTGAADTVYFYSGSGDAVTLSGTAGNWDSVVGSGGAVYLAGAQAGVAGGGNAIDFYSGAGDAVAIGSTAGDWDSVTGSGGTINLAGGQSVVTGGGDSVDFVGGSGNTAALANTSGNWDAVNGSGGAVYLASAQAGVNGGGDTVNFYSGSGNAVTLANTSGAWDAVNGSGGTIYLAGAQVGVTGGGNTIDFYSGTGDAVTVTGSNGDADTVNGSGGTVYIASGQATVTGSGDTVDFYGGTSDVATQSGASEAFVFQPAFGGDTINGFTAADSMTFNASDFAGWSALQPHISQSGGDTLITLDANDTVTLTGVKSTSLVSSQFHFV